MTDEKLALLEHITYIDHNVLRAAKINEDILRIRRNHSIAGILKVFNDDAINSLRNLGENIVDGAFISGRDWANIIETLKTDEELKNLKIRDFEEITTAKNLKYNLQICFDDKNSKQGIITYKGTSGYNEWDDNVKGIVLEDTPCQDNALQFFKRNEDKFDDIVVVGHSKGANKAMYVTIASNSDKISKCVAMDGQGFSNFFFKKYKDNIANHGGKITNYSVDRDFVHVLMKQIPNSKQKYCKAYGIKMGAQFHSPFAMFKTFDGKMDLSGPNKSPVFVDTRENKSIALIRKFVTFAMDAKNCSTRRLNGIAEYLGTFSGELLGNSNKRKSISMLLKNPLRLVSLVLLTLKFSVKEKVGFREWNGLKNVLMLNEEGNYTGGVPNYIKPKVADQDYKSLQSENKKTVEKGKYSLSSWKNDIDKKTQTGGIKDIAVKNRNFSDRTIGR